MRHLQKLILLCMLFSSVLSAGIINVPADIDSIQGGINMATEGDTVLVQPGTYVETINFNGKNIVVGSLTLTTGDTSYISQTVIDGDSSGSVVTFENGEDSTTIFYGFTVTNGRNNTGGGIYIQDSSPRLSHSILKNNTARLYITAWNAYGGGIFCERSNSILETITVRDNKAVLGQANYGNGIYFRDSSPTLVNIEVKGNTFEERVQGGGICCEDSDPFFSNVTVVGNSADYGGGIMFVGNCNPIFDSINRSNIYLNEAFHGKDLFSNADTIISIVVDTFTVMFPDSSHACPLNKFTFDILHAAVTSISEYPISPKEYSLQQNYPNPFNSTTNIEFSIPNSEFVTLKVYNILGEEVATLVSEKLAAGSYKYDWPARSSGGEASSLASGVYLYRIQAGNYVEIKKMVLLR